tara:strand:- start:3176 stop:3571 length:396 start_codon:yes stop_codon:yes gene_type:complete
MIKLISQLLVICILIVLIIYKRKYIINIFRFYKRLDKRRINKTSKINLKQVKNHYHHSKLQETNNFSIIEKNFLRKEMFQLFKGSQEEKIKALKIAKYLSDKSTLPLLKLGLKDMDSDIVKLSAKLMQKFK